MPQDFNNSEYSQEVVKTATQYPWLHLIEIEYETGQFLRLVNDNQDIVFNGETYDKFPFKLSAQTIDAQGKIPERTLQVGNASRYIESLIANKQGWAGKKVTIVLGQRSLLLQNKTARVYSYEITNTKTSEQWVNFTLSIPNINLKTFPTNKFFKNSCPYEYGEKGCKNPNSILVGNDIFFSSADDSINSTTTDFTTMLNNAEGVIKIEGSNNNDGNYIILVLTANKITVSTSITNESAGATVTVNGLVPNTVTFPDCDRTLSNCQFLENEDRFGGYPGIIYGALTRANAVGR